MEGIVGGSGYALFELGREFQAAVVHHQFEDRFRVDIRRTVVWNMRVLSVRVTRPLDGVGASAAGHSPPPGWQLRLSTLRRTAGCCPSVTPRTARPQSADVTPAEHARMGRAVLLCSSATRLGHRSPTTLGNFAGIVGKSTVDTCRGRWEVCRR